MHIYFLLFAACLWTQALTAHIRDTVTHITHDTARDHALWKSARTLCPKTWNLNIVQAGYYRWKKKHPYQAELDRVRNELITHHHAQASMVTTADAKQLSVLTFIRPKARATLLFVTGYFDYLTPTKEWCGPLIEIFKEYNIVIFDWRHVGQSAVMNKQTSRKLSADIAQDVVAMLTFCRTHSSLTKLPLIAHSFCLGGALTLHALTHFLRKTPQYMPDGIALSCTPANIPAVQDTMRYASPDWSYQAFFALPWLRSYFFKKSIPASIRALDPKKMLAQLSLPCAVDYTIEDGMVPLQNTLVAEEGAHMDRITHSLISEHGRHVRIHKYATAQYHDAYDAFYKSVSIKT